MVSSLQLHRKRAPVSWLAAALVLLCLDGSWAAPPRAPEKVEQSRGYLRRAIEEYRTAHPDRAFFHWRIARDVAPVWTSKQPEFHKLHGLLLLGEKREAEAVRAFTLALELKPDPFLHYLQGNYYLKFRDLRQARVAYSGAIAAFFQGARKAAALPSPEFTLPTYLPLVCPGGDPDKHDGWLQNALKNRFAATEWNEVHWRRTLSKEELAMSLLQAMLLTRHLNENPRAVEQYRGWLRSLDIAEHEVTFAPVLSILRAPLKDVNHTRCLHGLEAMKRKQEAIIASGSSEPAARHLTRLQEYLRRAHWNRIAVRGDVSAYYSYGSYLMREGKATEALHNFRRALALTQYRLGPDTDAGSIDRAAQSLRQIQFAYARTGKVKDASTAGKFADILEDLAFRLKNGQPGGADLVVRARKELIEKARANLRNREGLVFLIRHGQWVKGETEATLRARLAGRDERMDEEELLSAFQYLYE